MKEEELKRFRDYANHYQGSDVFFLMEHIDAQARQIATLKAALITERFLALDYGLGNLDFRRSMAKSQLAQEYPDIFKDDFICQMKGMESELVRWQKIAIGESAKLVHFFGENDIVPSDHDRGMAAKELGLQVKQEAGYVERLEEDYLDVYTRLLWETSDGDTKMIDCIHKAQAALEKIRTCQE